MNYITYEPIHIISICKKQYREKKNFEFYRIFQRFIDAIAKTAQQFVDPKVNQLIPIVKGYKSQGHTDDQIVSLLIKSGWSEDASRKAIDMTKGTI